MFSTSASASASASPSASSASSDRSPTFARRARARTGSAVLDRLAGSFAKLITHSSPPPPLLPHSASPARHSFLSRNHQSKQASTPLAVSIPSPSSTLTSTLKSKKSGTNTASSVTSSSRSCSRTQSSSSQTAPSLHSSTSTEPTSLEDCSVLSSSPDPASLLLWSLGANPRTPPVPPSPATVPFIAAHSSTVSYDSPPPPPHPLSPSLLSSKNLSPMLQCASPLVQTPSPPLGPSPFTVCRRHPTSSNATTPALRTAFSQPTNPSALPTIPTQIKLSIAAGPIAVDALNSCLGTGERTPTQMTSPTNTIVTPSSPSVEDGPSSTGPDDCDSQLHLAPDSAVSFAQDQQLASPSTSVQPSRSVLGAINSDQPLLLAQHRRAFSVSGQPMLSNQSPTFKHISWDQFAAFESCGSRSVHSALNSPVSHLLSRSGSVCTSPVRIGRNSLTPSRRRKSLKIYSPSRNISHSRHPSLSGKILNIEGQPGVQPVAIDADELLDLLAKSDKGKGKENEPPLLVIDLRSLNSYLGPNGRLKGSINVNFPSLLLKRFRKGNQNNFQLSSFITTEAGKRYYGKLEKNFRADSSDSSTVLTQLNLCVIDEQLHEINSHPKPYRNGSGGAIGNILLDVLANMFNDRKRSGGLYYLNERFQELTRRPQAQPWLFLGEQERLDDGAADLARAPATQESLAHQQSQGIAHNTSTLQPTGPRGLIRLRPCRPVRSLPSLDHDPPLVLQNPMPNKPGHAAPTPPRLTLAPSSASLSSKLKPPQLRRIDTSESLLGTTRSIDSVRPKSSLTHIKTDPATLKHHHQRENLASDRSLPQNSLDKSTPSLSRFSSRSTLGANLSTSILDTAASAGSNQEKSLSQLPGSSAVQVDSVDLENKHRQASSFRNSFESTASSVSPGPTTHPEISFKVSTIIPSFLYLGPEPCKNADFEELEKLGVKRVLNLALECTEEEELIHKSYQFIEKYYQIPLRDFVEEVGVQARIDEANKLLDDACLHSAPIYVHCKAGKSRSVTIVLAYLIHRFRWSLKQSYHHVSERRKGICPNIGFLAELMNYEERELGSKSHGVIGSTPVMRSVSQYCSPTSFHKIANEDAGKDVFEGFSFGGSGQAPHRRVTYQTPRHTGIRVRSVGLSQQDLPNFRSARDSLPAGFGGNGIS